MMNAQQIDSVTTTQISKTQIAVSWTYQHINLIIFEQKYTYGIQMEYRRILML